MELIDRAYPRLRTLYERIRDFEGEGLHERVLTPWAARSGVVVGKWLRSFAERPGDPVPPASPDDLWGLYALSCANDLLLFSFQSQLPGRPYDGHTRPLLVEQYQGLMHGLGMRTVAADRFTPFLHEIVTVEQNLHDDAPIEIVEEVWPGLMLGSMLFSRSGVVVSAGRNHVVKSVAESSTMFWASRRRHRSYHDLSFGWGSNSRWRTDFRRDYRFDNAMFLNVDGEHDLASDKINEDPDLTREERVELLLHRCLVTCEKAHHDLFPYQDLFPYDDRLTLPALWQEIAR